MNKIQALMINEELFLKIKSWLETQWTNNNYRFPTVSNFIQSALEEYRSNNLALIKGLPLTGSRKNVMIRLTEQQKNFYQSLTHGRKGTILDKILESYFLKQFDYSSN